MFLERFWSILILITSFSYCAYAQIIKADLPLQQIDISDGLSENIVLTIHEDKNGFIWLGTYDGLNKFDGYDFRIYREEFLAYNASSNNRVYTINQDNLGNLFIGKDEGYYLFNLKNNDLVFLDSLVGEPIKTVAKAGNNHLWMLSGTGKLLHVDNNNFDFEVFNSPFEESFYKNKTWSIGALPIGKDSLLISSNQGEIVMFDKASSSFEYFVNPYYKSKYYTSITLDNNNNCWMVSRSGNVTIFNPKTKTFTAFDRIEDSFTDLDFYYIYHDKSFNALLFCSKLHGLIKYDYHTEEITQFHIEVEGKKSLKSESVITVHRDSRDVLWLGTDQHGALVHDPHREKFSSLNTSRHNLDINIRMPRKMAGDNFGNVWIGSNNLGLWKYNYINDKLNVYTADGSNNFMVDNSAIQMYSEGSDLWIGHNGAGISVIDIPTMNKKKFFTLEPQDSRVQKNNVIWNFLKDGKDRMWIGTRAAGIYRLDENETKHYHLFNTNLTHNGIMSTHLMKDETVILATRLGGIYKFIESEDDFELVYPNSDSLVIAPKAITIDRLGNIWMGTDGRGIYILDDNFAFITKATVKEGHLRSDVVCSFLEDKDGNMWVSTNLGVSKLSFSLQDTTISSIHYSSYDGLTSDEFMTGAYYQRDSTFWFGSIAGVNYFNPYDIPENPYPIRSYINEIEVNNKVIFQDTNYYDIQNLDLEHNMNSISFSYNTIGYTIPEKTFYSYRLKGFDDEWSLPTTRTFTSFTNLRPGDYNFQLKAMNYDGVWTDDVYDLPINIDKAFWQTNVFRILLFLLIGLGAFLIYRHRIRTIKKRVALKNEYQTQLTDMEMKALRAQINPHFLFNTLNSINNYILQNEGDKASHYLVKFSKLMRLILSNSSSKTIPLSDELRALDLYIQMENMRFTNAFDYFLNIDPMINTDSINIPPMLLQPFVENAIWHGLLHKDGDKTLELSIKDINESLIKISIRDNGIGRKRAGEIKPTIDKGKSYGMSLTKKRIELLNKRIVKGNIESKVEIVDLNVEEHGTFGTEVNIIIPKK